MKFGDMLQMSASNLWKRKLRTILTILGVVIGVASIVVMVSLGLGLSRLMIAEYESFGSMTQIRVNEPYNYNGNGNSTDIPHLSDALVNQFSAIEHVESVYSVLDYSVLGVYGMYQGYLNLRAMPIEAIEEEGIEVDQGTLPIPDADELQFFYRSTVIESFQNSKTGEGYWSTGELPKVNLYSDPIFFIFDVSSYYASQNNDSKVAPPKKYLIPACGTEVRSEDGTYGMNDWYVYCDIEALKPFLKRIYKNSVIPGQPTTKTGKAYKEIFYSTLLVNVDDMDNVESIRQQISDMGYMTYSNSEMISSAQTSMGYVQAVLGGIGAVSLLVAAIGIANTMMMSIYERTREIGVMKVLGCDMGNIRMLFLLEAAMIGFVGGIMGISMSYGVSAIINFVVSGSGAMNSLGLYSGSGNISYIPIWLSGVGVVFATIIAMIAGFMPAQKAMKLSPLAAIRND